MHKPESEHKAGLGRWYSHAGYDSDRVALGESSPDRLGTPGSLGGGARRRLGGRRCRNAAPLRRPHLFDDTEPKVFRSADGDILVTNFTFHIVMDGDGNIVTALGTGKCP